MTSAGTARAQASERELAANRARKLRYRGTCGSCGASTSGCNGRAKAPKRCAPCSAREKGFRKRGQGPTISAAVSFCSEPRRWSEIRDHLGIADNNVKELLNRALRLGLLERARRGVYKRV